MVEHIVLWKCKPEATPAQKDALMEALLGLKERCAGITATTVGYNFSERSQGYEIGFRATFESRAALDAYLPSEPHQQVVREFVAPVSLEVCVVDYEF